MTDDDGMRGQGTGQVTCTSCYSVVSASLARCPYCGKDIRSTPRHVQRPPPIHDITAARARSVKKDQTTNPPPPPPPPAPSSPQYEMQDTPRETLIEETAPPDIVPPPPPPQPSIKPLPPPLSQQMPPPPPSSQSTPPPQQSTKEEDAQVLNQNEQLCPSCKSHISENAVMCYACGAKITPPPPAPPPVPKRGPNAQDGWAESEYQLTQEDIKQFENKLDDVTRRIRQTPRDAGLWFRRGSILMELLRYEDAAKAFNMGIEIEPMNIKAWSAKAFAANKMGDQKEAARCYKKALDIGMARSMDLDVLLTAVDRSENYKEALDKAITVLMQFQPKTVQTGNQQARCPSCHSFKVMPHGDALRCHKCGHVFKM